MGEELATFAGGCFWCIEAVFKDVKGVLSVESGYSGGTKENPTYKEVCSGATGHAEVCQIRFDPAKASFEQLLEIFFKVHDPTTLNRQGEDVGTQYRSAVFHHSESQRAAAERAKAAIPGAVTEIVPFRRFWKAEEYHQDYFARNPDQAYCRVVVRPKVEKFRASFREKLK